MRVVAAAVVLNLLFCIGLGTAAAGPSSVPATTTVVFPPGDLVHLANAKSLIDYIAVRLGLPPVAVDQITTSSYPETGLCCSLIDWKNRTVPVTNETTVIAPTEGGPFISIQYSETGKFEVATVSLGLFGEELASDSTQNMFDGLEMMAQGMGITLQPRNHVSWNGVATIVENGSGQSVPTTTVVSYGSFEGEPVAFGNELRVTFSQPHLRAAKLVVFPWFSSDSSLVSRELAFSSAIDYLNRTPSAGGSGRFSSGRVYHAFDSLHYNPTFQVEAIYEGAVHREFRVWVSPYSGAIDYVVAVLPHPQALPQYSPLPWAILVGLILVPPILIAGSARAFEPFGFLIFSFLSVMHGRIRKEEALDHFVRGQLYAYVVLNPGVSYSEIRDAFSLNNGTTTHHLVVLESMGFIRSFVDGRYKRFISQESGAGGLGRKLTSLQTRILRVARDRGSVGPAELARLLGVSRQRANYNLRKLVHLGFMAADSERKGKYGALRTDEFRHDSDPTRVT